MSERGHEFGEAAEAYGLAHWMRAVLDERKRVLDGPTPEAVHDLRVAIRRCRSMAECALECDDFPSWRKMRRAGKSLFQPLGRLRDAHVAMEWVRQLSDEGDSLRETLLADLADVEGVHWGEAQQALHDFNAPRWAAWSERLPQRLALLPNPDLVFGHLALTRWKEACRLHEAAVQETSAEAWHSLRIGVKKFRYLVENFLPDLYVRLEKSLKKAQDLLGDVHDLDVLASRLAAFTDRDAAAVEEWRARIADARSQRLAAYLRKTTGERSWWRVWREVLPRGRKAGQGASAMLEGWAMYRGADPAACRRAADGAQRLFDAVADAAVALPVARPAAHRILGRAAVLRDVARHVKPRKALKVIAGAPVTPGHAMTVHRLAEKVALDALGGASARKALAGLPEPELRQVMVLSGLLRAAEGLNASSA